MYKEGQFECVSIRLQYFLNITLHLAHIGSGSLMITAFHIVNVKTCSLIRQMCYFPFWWNYHACFILYGPLSTERLILVLVLYFFKNSGNHCRCFGDKTTPPPFYFIFGGKSIFEFFSSASQKWLRNGSHITHSNFQCQKKLLLSFDNVPHHNQQLTVPAISIISHPFPQSNWMVLIQFDLIKWGCRRL